MGRRQKAGIRHWRNPIFRHGPFVRRPAAAPVTSNRPETETPTARATKTAGNKSLRRAFDQGHAGMRFWTRRMSFSRRSLLFFAVLEVFVMPNVVRGFCGGPWVGPHPASHSGIHGRTAAGGRTDPPPGDIHFEREMHGSRVHRKKRFRRDKKGGLFSPPFFLDRRNGYFVASFLGFFASSS
jgi:hypothetical protein